MHLLQRLNTMIVSMALAVPAMAQHLTYDPNVMYSKLAMDSRMNDFYGNLKLMGFPTYSFDKEIDQPLKKKSKTAFDYVPGLVAKGVLECAEYYNKYAWAHNLYYTVEWFANNYAWKVPQKGGSLDDLNAAKIYCEIYDMTEAGSPWAVASTDSTRSNAKKGMDAAYAGLKKHMEKYSIKGGLMDGTEGGMWHKKSYPNQMWLDGQYMGPTLMAMLVNHGYSFKGTAEADWAYITRQFTIVWDHLWDPATKLLYHAFSATPKDSLSACWADPQTGRSQECWARAEGWYFLALVDVLAEMQKAGLTESPDYATLRGYLNMVADGLAARQDETSGCWYQLPAYGESFHINFYNGETVADTYNYLESSATAIFIAAYLKGQRLGLMDKDYKPLVEKAYKGFVEHFMIKDTEDSDCIHIIGSCRSAGLGGKDKRDGSAGYYLCGPDVSMVKESDHQTEGKVLGAFLLASLEWERK